jgi:hypothetical protein
MAGNPVLSTVDIAKETGLSRQRVWQLAVAGEIPAERANPGGKQWRFYESSKFAAWRKEKAARPKVGLVPRASQISRRRQNKIDKAIEIVENRTEVSASEKEAALAYCDYLLGLCRVTRETRLPLLKGLHALHGRKFTLEIDHLHFSFLKCSIADLPTAEET